MVLKHRVQSSPNIFSQIKALSVVCLCDTSRRFFRCANTLLVEYVNASPCVSLIGGLQQ